MFRALAKLGLMAPVLVTREALRLTSAVPAMAIKAARVVHNASGTRSTVWQAGRRLHVPTNADHAKGRALAKEIAEHADVVAAHWDSGLGSVVVHLAGDMAADRVLDWITERTAHHGITRAEPADEGPAHPGTADGVRTAALALAMDGAGLAVAVGTRLIRVRKVQPWLQAAVSAAREHPAARAWMNERFGWYAAELARAGVNAVAKGISQEPAELVLDTFLRTSQLAEAMARAMAFDTVHDDLCSPTRPSIGATPDERRSSTPVEEYASSAVKSGLMGALLELITQRGGQEAADAALAASPLPARYAHTAFHTAMGTALARERVLVRDPDRLRSLDTVDAVVLHASALRDDHGVDPHAEAVLDAARQIDARVVIIGTEPDEDLREFAALADEVITGEFTTLVHQLQDEGRVVLTAARPAEGWHSGSDEVVGLLAGDVCISVTEGTGPVLWGADLMATQGLKGVWRVLLAVDVARANSRRAKHLATGSAIVGGLLLVAGRRRTLLPPRLSPVTLGGVAGMAMGWTSALRVALIQQPPARARTAWHELTAEEVIERFRRTDTEPGPVDELTGHVRALARHPIAAPVHLAKDVIAELNDPLTPVLALGALASAVVGSPVDAMLVTAAIGLNAFVGGAQRFRGQRALAKLQTQERPRARKVVNGASVLIDASDLAPGDLIELRVNDVVPADARLVDLTDLEVDESALTGESLPVDKQLDPTPGAPVTERSCLVFAGTTVASGECHAIVVATGAHTVSGRALSLAARTPPAAGIQARLRELTRKALPLTLLGGAAVTGLSAIRGNPMRQSLAGGVAIAVAAVPEGLPLVATVAQRAAARRLSTRGILVRTPRALEALGRLDMVCFDKTGTLTQNRLRVTTTTTSDGQPAANGALLQAAAWASPGSNSDPNAHAHATDHAILEAAGPEDGWTELAGRPFEASRGYSAAVGRDNQGRTLLVVKGAPEVVLSACDAPQDIYKAGEALADNGLRVIAVASRELDGDAEPPTLDNGCDADVLTELDFLGFVGLADTPRDTAQPLVNGLRTAGIAPVMLTGDHPHTARAIATSLGWPVDTRVITGDELADTDRAARAELLTGTGVIARVAPEQKLQVIEALREAGKVTAMVGDGANDAAAIRAADVGIGVHARSSTAARTAADIALTEDDLTVLLEALDEGKALWRSVSDAVVILLGGNAGEIGFSVLATLIAGRSPLGTRQMLLVNLLTDLFPAMAVAVTRPDDIGQEGSLGTSLNRAITSRGVSTGIGATAAWLTGQFTPGTARRTSTMALCGLVGTQLAQTLHGRWRSPLVVGTAAGSALALAAIVQTPGVSQFFGCTPLGPIAWAGVAGGVGAGVVASAILPHGRHE